MAQHLSRNAPCPCGTGKKIKNCCGDRARRWKPVDLGNGVRVTAPPKLRAVAQQIEESPIPEWLIDCALKMSVKAIQPGARPGDVVIALLLIVTAGEAALNRLPEGVVTAEEWEGNGASKPIERLPMPEKWLHLSKRLGMVPPLSKGSGPLQAFLRTVEARNDLVHFKHGRNTKVFESRATEHLLYGDHVTIDIEAVMSAPKEQTARSPVEDALSPSKVEGYFCSLAELLLPVLNACGASPPGLAHSVAAMRKALGVEETGEPGGAPDSPAEVVSVPDVQERNG